MPLASSSAATLLGAAGLAAVLPLFVFPENDLAHSILTTTFVGLLVMVFFNECFGWVLSGLIVPGYLAPIFIVQPYSAVVIVVEAVITYLTVRFMSDTFSKTRLWSRYFGRDRFFAFLLFGIAIRCVNEGFVVPLAGQWVNETFGLAFDHRSNLYSIGLVIVPLLANAFWKPGLARGGMTALVSIGITYVLIAHLLIPLTNFSISNFEIFYGYHAASFLGNVKASIILLTGAYLASRTNHLYGWDYNGILVPALLALAWFEPIRVAATVVEAALVVVIARWIGRTPWLRTTTIEGGRRFLLVYAVSYAIKMALGFGAESWWPGFAVKSLYGFGYLLPSLIATKMWDKGALIVRPLLQTSLIAMIGGGLMSAFLRVALPMEPAPRPLDALESRRAVEPVEGDLLNVLAFDRWRLVRPQADKGFDRPLTEEVYRFRLALQRVQRAIAVWDDAPSRPARDENLRAASRLLREVGYELVELTDARRERTYLYLRERAGDPGRLHGWGLYVFPTAPAGELVLQVPRPVLEPEAMDAAVALLERLPARALLIHGSEPSSRADGSADALRFPFSPFQVAHVELRDHDVVQVRLARADRSSVHFAGEIPLALDLSRLREMIGPFEQHLAGQGHFEERNIQRETARRTFTTIAPSRAAARRLVFERAAADPVPIHRDDLSIVAFVIRSLHADAATIARRGSEAYVPPTIADAIFFDERVLQPLLEVAEAGLPIDRGRLAAAALAARSVGYEVVRYRTEFSPVEHLVLREMPARRGARRHWGLFVFRAGGDPGPFVIEVPRPVTEFHTVEAGARLHEYLHARALLIATASREANASGNADVAAPANILNMFQLAHQVCQRGAAPGSVFAIQVKGFAQLDPFAEPDVVISTGRELRRPQDVPPPLARLRRQISLLGPDVAIFDGTLRTRRFHGGGSAQKDYSDTQAGGAFATLWLSDEFRRAFRGRPIDETVAEALLALDIERAEGDLGSWLASAAVDHLGRPVPEAAESSPAEMSEVLDRLGAYSEFLNVLDLARVQEIAAETGGRLRHFTDSPTQRGYIVFLPPPDDPRFVVVVNPHALERRRVDARVAQGELGKTIDEFIRRNWGSLVIRREKSR